MRPHGIRGEIVVAVDPSMREVLRPGVRVELRRDDAVRAAEVLCARPHRAGFVVRLSQIDDRNSAEACKGEVVWVGREDLPELREGEYYDFEIVGAEVVTREGEALGIVREIIATGASDVYVVEGAGGDILLPASRAAVLDIDRTRRRITVERTALEYCSAIGRKP